eukprot:m.186058 g.186058  ORF g.186058 m.186058 type:complete len:154 (+) comp15586_c0_seq7:518-979(+)
MSSVIFALQDSIDEVLLQRQTRNISTEQEKEKYLGRRLIWSHHIKSTTKRKHIRDWSGELELGGYAKTGYPGIIIVEGDERNCIEFCRRLKNLRWKALLVKGEEREEIGEGTVEDLRKIQRKSVLEVGEDGMSFLAEQCKSIGLEDLFLTQMH